MGWLTPPPISGTYYTPNSHTFLTTASRRTDPGIYATPRAWHGSAKLLWFMQQHVTVGFSLTNLVWQYWLGGVAWVHLLYWHQGKNIQCMWPHLHPPYICTPRPLCPPGSEHTMYQEKFRQATTFIGWSYILCSGWCWYPHRIHGS